MIVATAIPICELIYGKIENDMSAAINASVTFFIAAACSFVGLIHGATIQWNAIPVYTATYAGFILCFVVIHCLSKSMKGLQPDS